VAGCPAKGSVHIVHTFVHGRLFDLHVGPFLRVLPSLLHAVLCFRRHDFAAQTVGFVGSSRQRERLRGVCGWRSIRSQSGGVWDPDFFRGGHGAQGCVACLFVHLRGQCGPRLTCPA
jgi:hypothetical protein